MGVFQQKKPVNEALLDLLASFGLTTPEIAAVLECSSDTLERNYSEQMANGKAKARASVRRKQFELAMKGNVTMLIWLGKNMLGQTDKNEVYERDTPFSHDVPREAIIERIAGNQPTPPAVQ